MEDENSEIDEEQEALKNELDEAMDEFIEDKKQRFRKLY